MQQSWYSFINCNHELPYEEWHRVPPSMATAINAARLEKARHRHKATVVRTLEIAIDAQGQIHPDEGWTALVIAPERDLDISEGRHAPFRALHLAHQVVR